MSWRGKLGAAVGMVGLAATPAIGSGGPEPTPLYIDRLGGTQAELARLYDGRTGLIMGRSPSATLYMQWRLLHGLQVGRDAGPLLSLPCCTAPSPYDPERGVYGWLTARSLISGIERSPDYLPIGWTRADYSFSWNCYGDAFDTATATLRDRAARYGRESPAVRAWLLTQDAVFEACSDATKTLPPLPADAPAWLRADRAYQEAAFALYNGRNAEAATRFHAIARDTSSPWRGMGLYLRARALQRQALAANAAESAAAPQDLLTWIWSGPYKALAFAQARLAHGELAAAPEGTYGRGEARKMLRALAYRDQPDRLLAELDLELNEGRLAPDVDFAWRDYMSLSRRAAQRPEAADWILTMQADARAPALRHARERWTQSRDPAWLIAALAMADPGEAGADALAEEAARIARGRPAWTTAQYHLIRLTLGSVDPAVSRARLDAILAMPALTLSERNIFAGMRAQVTSDLADFARFAARRPYCLAVYNSCNDELVEGERRPAVSRAPLGFGAEASAIIDRMPLDTRIALSRQSALPDPLRLDIALTSFARAVQLQDNAAIDALAGDLASRLPQLRADWRAIAALPPGPAKRFAEFFVMAKLPGLRTDLIGYTRPEGGTRDFRGFWVDWVVLPRRTGRARAEPPAPDSYRPWDGDWFAEGQTLDLTCLGRCGRASFPLRLPPFVAAAQSQASEERAYFFGESTGYGESVPEVPVGAVSLWDETLAYARAHPNDPRSPEVLYWLIRVARWGGNHNHLGRRAFQLLHQRYSRTSWARRSPYYYDG